MSRYLSELGNLMELVQAGADPMGMYGEFQALKDDRHQRYLERQQAEQEAQAGILDSLMGYAFDAAGSPSSMQEAVRMAGAEQQFQTNPAGALDALFYPAKGRNAGLSRIDPELPEDTEYDVQQIVADEYRRGIDDPLAIERTVHRALGYGPRVMGGFSQDIREMIDRALSAADGGGF